MDVIITPEKTAIVTGISKSAKILSSNNNSSLEVLDYGCGKLRNSKYLLNEGFDVSILDTSKQISSLSKIDLNLFKDIYELDNLDLNNIRKYKSILCSFVLNVIPNENDRLTALNNIYSLLSNDGTLYLEVRGKGFLKNAKSKIEYNDGYILGLGKTKTFQKGFNKDDLNKLISKTSFKIDNILVNGDSLIAICKK